MALTVNLGSFKTERDAIQSSEIMSLSMTTGTGSWADTAVVPLNTPSTQKIIRHTANLLAIVPSFSLHAFMRHVEPRVWRNQRRRASAGR